MAEKEKKKYRIDGFEQLSNFYSIVFSGEFEFTPQHISLYLFLFNQCNRSHWIEWFKCPFDLAMTGSGIGSRKTYYKVLKDLDEWKLIKYEAGLNNWKAPKIHLFQIGKKGQANVPLCEQVDAPLLILLPTPLPTPLRVRYINIITNNINNIITDNYKSLLLFDFDFEKFFENKFYKKENKPANEKDFSENDVFGNLLLEDEVMLSDIETQTKVKPDKEIIKVFNSFLRSDKKTVHPDFDEYCRHLRNWLNLKPEFKHENNSKNGSGTELPDKTQRLAGRITVEESERFDRAAAEAKRRIYGDQNT